MELCQLKVVISSIKSGNTDRGDGFPPTNFKKEHMK